MHYIMVLMYINQHVYFIEQDLKPLLNIFLISLTDPTAPRFLPPSRITFLQPACLSRVPPTRHKDKAVYYTAR